MPKPGAAVPKALGSFLEVEQKLCTTPALEAQSSQKQSPELPCPSSALQQCLWVALPSQTLSLPPRQSHKELMQTDFPITRASPARKCARKLSRELPG